MTDASVLNTLLGFICFFDTHLHKGHASSRSRISLPWPRPPWLFLPSSGSRCYPAWVDFGPLNEVAVGQILLGPAYARAYHLKGSASSSDKFEWEGVFGRQIDRNSSVIFSLGGSFIPAAMQVLGSEKRRLSRHAEL